MSKYINLIEKLYNSNIIDINHLSRYRKKYEKSNLDERKHLDATCDEIFKADINKLNPTSPSKLEQRRKKQEKQGKNIGIISVVIGIIVFLLVLFNIKSTECECLDILNDRDYTSYEYSNCLDIAIKRGAADNPYGYFKRMCNSN